MAATPEIQAELIALAERFSRGPGLQTTAIAELQIARSERITDPIPSIYTPCLCFIVQGEKNVVLSGKSFVYSSSQYLVTSVSVPVTSHVTEATPKKPYLCFVVELSPRTIFEVLQNEPEARPAAPPKRGIFLSSIEPDLADAMLRLARCLRDARDSKVLAPMILREITYRLLDSKFGEAVRQMGQVGGQTQRISQVIELIRHDYARKLSTAELAKMAHMSASSLHQHFKKVTTLSPLQYQKQIRLQEARRLLHSERGDAASVAFAVGYESASQFNREYARYFGLPPIRDRRSGHTS